MKQNLLERFKRNDGYLSKIKDLTTHEKYQLRVMVRKEIITRVKRGLYHLNGLPEANQEIEVSKIIPSGIFCMYTAWAYHELSTFISSEYHVAIDKSLKINLPVYPPIKLHFWSIRTLELGLIEIKIKDARIRIFDLERSVCDAVKFRNKIGIDLLSEILRNYVRRKDKNLDKLFKFANELRISTTLTQLIRILI
jgi:predicted transcriptional regulator of viral defense system